MTRPARQISPTGCYHIMFRGMSRCALFEEDEDFEKLLALIMSAKAGLGLKLYAYCLMGSHAHLVVQEDSPGDVIMAMRKVLGPYASWFNRKYFRSGALVANRYRSECVKDDRYLLALVRYIHQNPVVAGISKDMEGYRWSSYKEYMGQRQVYADTGFVLGLFSQSKGEAVDEFIGFHKANDGFSHSLIDKPKKARADIQDEVQSLLQGKEPGDICSLPKQERDTILAMMKRLGLSVRQIERMTGISRGIVARAKAS